MSLPSPYNVPVASIQFEFLHYTFSEYLIVASPSINDMILKKQGQDDIVITLGGKPSSITEFYEDQFLVTFNSSTLSSVNEIEERHIYNATHIADGNTAPVVHTKAHPKLRDMASTYIKVPISDFDTALYLVLTGEYQIERVRASDGQSLALY
jgi:hypothetical protein